MSQLTERLPLELLEKVLACTSVPDIVRMKQVTRGFHDFIQNSPWIKHRIDLFAVGLEDNPASNLTLADKRRALDEYRTKWDTFNPTHKWKRVVDNLYCGPQVCGPGVYGFISGSQRFIEFLTLESVSRGIPRKEWRLPLPEFELSSFAINPSADLLVVCEKKLSEYTLHLWSMTGGEPHPAAEHPIISCPRVCEANAGGKIGSISTTSSRVALLAGKPGTSEGMKVVVWEWRTGRILLDGGGPRCEQLEFVNEHSFVLLLGPGPEGPSQLQVFNTERGTSVKPIQTSFTFSPYTEGYPSLCPSLEPYGHTPSPDEPFYPDRSQRILAIYFGQRDDCRAINTELLLRLAREREGQDVGWDEWGVHTIEADVRAIENDVETCVSGCRLFCTALDRVGDNCLWMYDFSHAGRAKRQLTLGGWMRMVSPSLDGHKLTCGSYGYCDAILSAGIDNIAFSIDEDPDRPYLFGPTKTALHIWSLWT